jgi:hypothetical protein
MSIFDDFCPRVDFRVDQANPRDPALPIIGIITLTPVTATGELLTDFSVVAASNDSEYFRSLAGTLVRMADAMDAWPANAPFRGVQQPQFTDAPAPVVAEASPTSDAAASDQH